VVIFVRASFLLLLFSFLAVSVPAASQLAVKVTVTQDTLAVGTNVTLVTGGVELAQARAGTDGYARFNVTDGSYFVVLRRYPYPLQVVLVTVSGNTDVTLTMHVASPGSPANIYGQVTGPQDFSGTNVTAYMNGLVQKKAVPNKDGFYTLSFLPEGTYDVEFDSPGFVQKKVQLTVNAGDYAEADAALEKVPPPSIPQASLQVPSQVQQFSVIEAVLMYGDGPYANQTLTVETPSGKVDVTTDSQGRASINAAEGGTYTFAYGNLSQSTSVVASGGAVTQPEANASPEQPPAQPQQPVQQQGQSNLGAIGIVALAFLAIVGLAALVIVAIGLLRGKGRHGYHGHKHPYEKKGQD
jgi:Carboxypeptidase regulatory-like domain